MCVKGRKRKIWIKRETDTIKRETRKQQARSPTTQRGSSGVDLPNSMIRKLSQAVGNCSTGAIGLNGSSFHNGRMRLTVSGLVWGAMKQIQGPLEHDSLLFFASCSLFGTLTSYRNSGQVHFLSAEVSAPSRLPGVSKAKNKMGQKLSVVILLRFEMTEFIKLNSSVALRIPDWDHIGQHPLAEILFWRSRDCWLSFNCLGLVQDGHEIAADDARYRNCERSTSPLTCEIVIILCCFPGVRQHVVSI